MQPFEGFRLSPQQEHLWHLQASDALPYRAECEIAIAGPLAPGQLKAAVEAVVKRHEILRTTFQTLPGVALPFQVIGNPGVGWAQADWSDCSPQAQQARLEAQWQQAERHHFDFAQGPLLQVSLIRQGPMQHLLLIHLTALCADSVTLSNLVSEIAQAYTPELQGIDSEPLQYADLAEWQQQLLEGAETQVGRDFWRQPNLGQMLPALQLPFEQRGEAPAFQPQHCSLALPADLVARIDALAQTYNTSAAVFCLTCWQVLLWRFIQQPIVVGVGCEGRKYSELDTALGLLAKFVPWHGPLQGDRRFIDLLQQTQAAMRDLNQWQEYFTWDALDLSPSAPQFLPFCFEFESFPEPWTAADVSFAMVRRIVCTDRFNVKLTCCRQGEGLSATLHYNANAFQAEDIQRFGRHFQTLATSATQHPEAAISQLALLSPREQQLLLDKATALDYPTDQGIHQLFEAQVSQTPTQTALICEQSLTYAELNARANQLAHQLRHRGIKAGDLVGLCVERSAWMVIGVLGILKAGAAYVPLDPTYPQERLEFMLREVKVSLLLTQGDGAAPLPELSVPVIDLDNDWPEVARLDNLCGNLSAANLAYVIYTSGSTGQPKGVRITHRNLCHYVQAMQQAVGVTAEDVYLHTASIAFSSSVRQLLVPLCRGATVVIATTEQRADPLALFQLIQQRGVTVIDIVPSYWRSCLQALDSLTAPARLALLDNSLRLILSASEPLLSDIPRQWRWGLKHPARLLNMFGQTETSGIVTVYPIAPAADAPVKVTPLGRPIANTQIYLLDQHLQPVPIGVPGELYIGGPGLAEGYLHHPDLTAAKFIPHPYSLLPGDRLYQTGDRGRYLGDGTIEFLSRADHQVKLRGFRVELGEIEAKLSQHPAVRQAVVVVREAEPGQKSLAAYVVPAQEATASDLGQFLREKLPDYMVPATFVFLSALPLTPNGKIDRTALLAVDSSLERAPTYQPPRTPVEEALAGIWAQVLQQERVSIDANFFELGGHSLLATQVMSQVRSAFQVEVPLRSLFESPTVAGLGERIEAAIRAGQRAMPPIEPVPRSGSLPLSFAQQRLWFLEQFQPGNGAYNLARALRLRGALNRTALEQSFNEILRRHEALRTSFSVVDGQPVQVIATAAHLELPLVDLRGLPLLEREQESQRLAKREAQQPFDLTQAPLLRLTLLQLEAQDYLLLITLHHSIADGWSAGILMREVAALYASAGAAVPAEDPVPELPVQYADFAVWQRQWLQGEVLAAHLAYWKQQLGDRLPVLSLPTDRPRPPVQTFQGKTRSWQFSRSLTQELKHLSQQQGVTLFMTLLAAFKTLLYRYTGQTEMLIGSPIANRNQAQIEGLIGFFVNTLVLRTDLSGDPSFRELLQRVRETTLGAYAHQDLPFEKLVEALQPERNLSHSPLFQVMFALQNAPLEALALPGLHLELSEIESNTARFDLTLSLVDTEQGLLGRLEYNSDLFDPATIDRMLGHFQTLLVGIVADPNQSLATLPLLSTAERQQFLAWNGTQADYPQDQCLHQLFEAQVEQTPDAIAVVAEQHLSYQELNTRADQLANYLQTLGVGPDVLVGLCVERSVDMVVGLLGILKAGGAYIPLDPAYPSARLAAMLDEVSLLLTQAPLLGKLPPSRAEILCLDTDWHRIAQPQPHRNVSRVCPHHLAYVIYTSGSTGRPKGVQIPHRAVVNFLTAIRRTPGLYPQDILLSVTTLSFDIAALELFLPLTVGACVVVASRAIAADGLQLRDKLRQTQATVMQATPSTWKMLLAAGWPGSPQLRIFCCGEALSQSLAQELQQRCAGLWNLYGPTETTIWSLIQPVGDRQPVIPIGRPIANTQVYILDSHQQMVPIGVPGELYIGGEGLARGYLNQPDLTAAKFIQNPFQPGQLLYKTGDLTRYRASGEIEFLGRLDHQVKVRGYRIELAEIEARLSQHPAVREAVVLASDDPMENQHLVAYLVPSQEALTTAQMQQWLQQTLPAYMVPAAYVWLPDFPLTPNGKVDRRALLLLEPARPDAPDHSLAVRTPTEELLTAIWRQLLPVEPVSIQDHFFELGGHSLLATQLMSRIHQVFRVELPLQALFERPTVRELAAAIEIAQRQGDAKPASPPLCPAERHARLPLSFAQQRLWFLEQLEPGATYNLAAAVRLTGQLDADALAHSIRELIRRHEALRTTFTLAESQPVQVIHPPWDFQLPIIDFPAGQNSTAPVEEFLQESARQPFDLEQGPLLRVSLLRLSPSEHVVLFVMHHIIADGWSMGILIRELAAFYDGFSTGTLGPNPGAASTLLPALPVQYADFAVWQRQWLQGETLTRKLAYWQQQLENLPLLQLPTDHPREAAGVNRGAAHSFKLSPSLSAALLDLSHQENVTLFMTLLAAFQTLLHRYTHQEDIVVGTDVANRNPIETEGLIGFFVNLLVLRTDLSGNPSFRDLLQRVRDVALGAYAHQDLPFEKLVEVLRPERQLNHTPLVQVLFVLQNAPTAAWELPGLTLERLEIEPGTARFDLALFLTETEEGFTGTWRYNAELFEAGTIARLSGHWQTLLSSLAAQPDSRINALELLTETEKAQQMMDRQARKDSRLQKFASIRPRTVSLIAENLITTSYLDLQTPLPLVIQPSVEHLDLADWVQSQRGFLETELLKHGAILFRGFGIATAADFETLARGICPELFGEYGDLPREGISGKVYSSTPYPPDQPIRFHNESSHLHCWPQKIWFCCLQPAQSGGETPIVDCRRVYQQLDPQLRSRLEQKQLMYVRNYTAGLDVSWQDFFHTGDRTVVEAYCRQAGIQWEWQPNGNLKTCQVRPAVLQHPKTAEWVFFNQIQLHHPSCLEPAVRESLLSLLGENLPRNVCYGDGSAIEDTVVAEILAVYQAAQVSFPWQPGDVLMLDNLLVAHGRNPFVGPRKVVVALGEMQPAIALQEAANV